MDDETKPVTGDWGEATRKSEQTWDKGLGKAPNAPEQSTEDVMERTEEGYGSGKEGADPETDNGGRTPANPAG